MDGRKKKKKINFEQIINYQTEKNENSQFEVICHRSEGVYCNHHQKLSNTD